jgi:hypothetical protein
MLNLTEAPVLFIVFNRPDTTQRVFNAIKKARPQKLFIAVDAPRSGNIDDEKNCAKVKEIVKQVDWECQTYCRFAETNQGCGNGVFNAISWAFENEDRLIVLEDDCVPSQPFFSYCHELLERYRNDTRIWIISGNQYYEEAVTTPHSYFFSHYGHNWGWATWKRAWSEMDMSMAKFPLIIEQDLYKAAFSTDKEAAFFQKNADKIYKNKELKPHTWDCQFGFTVTSNGGLSIIPAKNLVSNIGYWGSHTETKHRFHDRPVDENFKIISHPDFILRDNNYDIYHFEQHWNKKESISKRLIRKIYQILKRGKNN